MTPDRRRKLAEIVSTVLGPVPMGVLLGLAVGVQSGRGLLAGAGWGLLSVICAAVLPAIATAPLRRRDARTTRIRLTYMAPAVLGGLLGLGILWLTPSPFDVRVLACGFAAGLICSTGVNVFYASSNHLAALAGGTVLAAALLTPWALFLAVSLAPQAWSRVVLGAHSVRESWLGAVVGALSAMVVVLTVR